MRDIIIRQLERYRENERDISTERHTYKTDDNYRYGNTAMDKDTEPCTYVYIYRYTKGQIKDEPYTKKCRYIQSSLRTNIQVCVRMYVRILWVYDTCRLHKKTNVYICVCKIIDLYTDIL